MSRAAREIYIISDLHLGGDAEPGERGFRICTHEADLAEFIGSLAERQRPEIELVINGDVVDFLAEAVNDKPPRWSAFHFPPAKAVESLDRIVNRCPSVFAALSRFLSNGHRLVILPGNHDIELNLPAVRRRLRDHVGAKRGGDYEFVGHGEAYRVGDVLIEHGNRVDDMNFVDYHVLRHLCGMTSREMAIRDEFLFDPPAGSKLVAEVINDIKQKYSFIDLLKPETEAAFPVILALEPRRRRELVRIANALARGKLRRAQQLLRYNSTISAKSEAPRPAGASEATDGELERILLRTVGRADFGLPASEAGTVQEVSLLGMGRSFASLLLGDQDETLEHRLHDLLDALREFQGANSFDRSTETAPVYLNQARQLAQGPIRHVVFGHTHLAKRVALPDGKFYFNSGTWADLLQLPEDILDRNKLFSPMAALEKFVHNLRNNDFSQYLLFHPTYVRIQQDSGGHSLSAELCDYPGGCLQ